MTPLTDKDLKTRGVSAIETALAKQSVTVISVRSKNRYAVMDIAEYNYLREYELGAALAANKADIAAGRYKIQTAQEHVDEITAEIASAS